MFSKNLTGFCNFVKKNDLKYQLPIVAGVDKMGRKVKYDLAKSGGVLISGNCGTGKTVLAQQFVHSIMLSKKPNEVNFLLCTIHKGEYDIFKDSPYLYRDVLEDEEAIFDALKDITVECERRFDLLSKNEVNGIDTFNTKVEEGEKLPYIVIVLDDANELFWSKREEKEELLMDLITKGRRTGVICILICQSVRLDYISRRLKNNFFTSFAFMQTHDIDSYPAVGGTEATDLNNYGECLVRWRDSPELVKIKTAHK